MGSSLRICQRMGGLAGFAIGLVFAGASAEPLEIAIAGFLVALLATGLAGLFLLVIGGYHGAPLLVLTLLVSLFSGLLLAPVATIIPSLSVAMAVCGLLGVLLGWLLCSLLCRYVRVWSVSRVRP
jgi:hypothetical protein